MNSRARPATAGDSFSDRIIAWQTAFGRHDLPWQRSRDHSANPYRIWLSEIMLQQTQVATVIPYFERFIAQFPDVRSLAIAPLESVMACWAGLGYYSRARNLYQCAQRIVKQYDGEFPRDVEALMQLPGIGRSTAAAIAALAFGERAAILDGNVKRVLARHFGIQGYPATPHVARVFWQCAEAVLPDHRIEAYTQGLMDLGATVCVRTRPVCSACPVAGTCVARRDHTIDALPTPRPQKVRPVRTATLLIIRDADGAVLLEPRPPAGVWGGLFSAPEFDPDIDAEHLTIEVRSRYGLHVAVTEAFAPIHHEFTHYTFVMQPRVARLNGAAGVAGVALRTVRESELMTTPLPAPIRKLLLQLMQPALV